METYFLSSKNVRTNVKNLRWLLDHVKDGINLILFDYRPSNIADGRLIVYFNDGKKFVTDFASLTVLWSWFLARKQFHNQTFVIVTPNGESVYKIGDDKYKSYVKKNHSELIKTIIKDHD